MVHGFKGFTPEWAGLWESRISQQKGRETAHTMAVRKQKDRIKVTTFFSSSLFQCSWLVLSHSGQDSGLSVIPSGTVLTNT